MEGDMLMLGLLIGAMPYNLAIVQMANWKTQKLNKVL